jgi:thiosulfate dehydrogenase (quinone) large subunit
MTEAHNTNPSRRFVEHVDEPPVARAIFGSTRLAWLWLILRVYVGYEWISAGYDKLTSPAWTGAQAGSAISGFVQHALSLTGGAHPTVQAWYATFLRDVVLAHPGVWSYMIAWGETLVGLGLILGIFTGIAAFFGSILNVNYLLAGSVSTNPILFVIATWLVLAWRTAGWWGVDRWLLPALGTPWRPGLVFHASQDKTGGPQASQA